MAVPAESLKSKRIPRSPKEHNDRVNELVTALASELIDTVIDLLIPASIANFAANVYQFTLQVDMALNRIILERITQAAHGVLGSKSIFLDPAASGDELYREGALFRQDE